MSAADAPGWRYRSRGRTPLNLALLAIGLGLLGLAVALQARPLAVFLPLAGFAAMLAWVVLRDPRAGLEIDRGALTLWQGERRESVPLTEIERVVVRHLSDSTDVTVHRRDGGLPTVPDPCRPAAGSLVAALRRAGIAVTED